MAGCTGFFERGFDNLLGAYEAGLKIVLRHRFATLMVMFGTIALTGYLYVIIPKGFFPQQDTGMIIGLSEAAQDISLPGHGATSASVDRCRYAGSGCGLSRIGHRCRRRHHHGQQWPHVHRAQAEQPTCPGRPGHRAAAHQSCQDPGHHALHASRAGHHHRRAACPRPSINTPWTTPTLASSTIGLRSSSTRSERYRGSSTSQPISSMPGRCSILPSSATSPSSFGIQPYAIDNTLDDAFGQRIVSTMLPRSISIMSSWRSSLSSSTAPKRSTASMSRHRAGSRCPLATLVDSVTKVSPLVVNHQGQFPSVTISFNLKPGTAIGQAVAAIQQVEKAARQAVVAADELSGQRAGIHRVAVEHADPHRRRALRHLPDPRRPLREPDPPDHHHLDSAVGRPRRVAAADGGSLRPERDRDRRHHPAHRHRQEERHHAGRLRLAHRTERGPDGRGIDLPRPACCAFGRS
jgi:hypothetical protein